jgi:hypothetical protein
MWFLKSIRNGNLINVEGFITESLYDKYGLQKIQLTYEKLFYMIQKDLALSLIAKVINTSYLENISNPKNICYPKKLFTMSKDEIELSFSIKEDIFMQLEIFYKNVDKIKYATYKNMNNIENIEPSIEEEKFRYYEPNISIHNFLENNLVLLKQIEQEYNTQDQYDKLVDNVYKDQMKLAKTIFTEIDENDKIGLFNVYKQIMSFVLHEDRDIRKIFTKNKNYQLLKDEFPIIELDIEMLSKNHEINNNKPYIIINHDDNLYWKYNIGCFSAYFSFITNKDENTDWKLLSKIFPQFPNSNDLRNNARKLNYDFIDLLAILPSFKQFYENKDRNKSKNGKIFNEIDRHINEIISKNNELHIKFDFLHKLKKNV